MNRARGYRPNLFIVGAPKSGTTAMADWLREHPDIFFPARKEISWFGSDLHYSRLAMRPASEEAYLAHFNGSQGARWAGEGSVFYLASQRAAVEIRAFSPDAHVIVMLRNPVEVMYALFLEQRYNGSETVADFGEALAAASERRQGQRIPPGALLREALVYRDVVAFAPQLRRYLASFGRDRVHVILFDDFKASPETAYRGVLDFLGLPLPPRLPEFTKVNPTKEVRSRLLQRTLRSGPFRLANRLAPDLAQRVYAPLRRLNTRFVPRPALSPELRARLTSELAGEVADLGRLLGRDLGFWSTATTPPGTRSGQA